MSRFSEGRTCLAIITACLLTELNLAAGNPQSSVGLTKSTSSDSLLTTTQLIKKYGYPVESHQAVTQDGYILTIHRIPYSPKGPDQGQRPAVFLQHGLLSSSADWVLPGPENGLAYYLSDAGYDVWMGNFRGSTYSRKHQKLKTSDSLFWDFSFHEIGIYDVPTMVDYVLEKTGQPSLFYVGHSLGATAFFVMNSVLPQYNAKIRMMAAVAPGGFFSKATNMFFRLSQYSKVGPEAEKSYNFEFLPISTPQKAAVQIFCNAGFLTQPFCKIPFAVIGVLNLQQLNRTLLPVILSHIPAGSSFKVWVHVGQLVRSGKFQQYDHGRELNIKYYGSPEPPSYDLTKVTTPVSIHAGKTDALTPVENSEKLYQELPNAVGLFVVPLREFKHFDFIWGIDAKKIFYPLLTDLLSRY